MGENKKELARVALKKQAVPAVEAFRSGPERLAELGREYGVAPVDLARLSIPVSLLDWVPRETAISHAMLPIHSDGEALTVVMADPRNQRAIEELAFVTGLRVEVLVASKLDVLAFVERAYAAQRRGELTASGPAADEAGFGGSGSTDGGAPFDEFAGFQSLSLRGEALAEIAVNLVPNLVSSLGPGAGASVNAPAAHCEADTVPGFPDLTLESLELSAEFDRPIENEEFALVVDDDAAIRGLVVRLLQSRGLRSIQAETGAEALRVLLSDAPPPSLLVLDAMLPEVHGFDVLRQLRAEPRLSALPVIVLTAVHRGWRFAEDLRAMSGVQHYIEKPFESAQLFAAVDELFGQKPPAGPSDKLRRCLEVGIAATAKGDFSLAERELSLGLDSEPLAHQIHFQLGIVFGKQGRGFEAINAFERAVGIHPRYFAGVKNLAVLYQRAGFQNKSAEMWERALALAPDQATRESIRDHLLRLL